MSSSQFDDLSNKILERIGANSLESLSTVLPSSHTKDIHIESANISHTDGDLNVAFHQLSLSHSTQFHHNLARKLHRPIKQNANTAQHKKSQKDVDSDSHNDNDDAINNAANLLNAEKDILRGCTSADTIALLEQLPSDWTVLQLTSNSSINGPEYWQHIGQSNIMPSLIISRSSCGFSPTIIIKCIKPPVQSNDVGVRSIIQEVDLIKGENKIMSKDFRDDQNQTKYKTKKEELNNRMKCVVRSMESAWLRHWSCLLVGSLELRHQKVLQNVTKEILGSVDVSLTDSNKLLLQTLISCPIAPECGHMNTIDQRLPLQAGVADILNESIRSKKVRDLTAAIKKQEIVLDPLRRMTRNPIIIIIDKALVTLPWEMMSVLRDQPSTRMPSLRSLALLYKHHAHTNDSVLVQGIDPHKGYYILDPESNLPRTQQRLQQTLNDLKWPGIIGRPPQHQEFKQALANNDLFVYLGHGSGSQYLPGELVETMECRSAVILYGCNSVRLARTGRIPDPWGVVLNYLIASCPCVVGMLWEVTDKDTDQLTKEMLGAIFGKNGNPGTYLENPPSDLPLLVSKSRSTCMQYLTAAALTVYGLPLHILKPDSQT